MLLLTIGIYSCDSKVKSNPDGKNNKSENQIPLDDTIAESKKEVKFMDTIHINYNDHKTLLNILKALPENTMDSWEWSKKDRVKTVSFIEENNYLIDSTKMYNNILYIKPNTIGIQVVDGYWTLSIYEFADNHYFIVTNDIVGDGNDIQTFNYINKELIPLKMINWFGEFDYKLLSKNTPNCMEQLEEYKLTYIYNFKDKNTIEIISWLLTKNESENCFKGNSIKYKLNKEGRTFDVVAIYWTKNKISENEKPQKIDNKAKLKTIQDSESIHVQTKINAFVESLKNEESLSKYFSNTWSLLYHEDNRCDGTTNGQINSLSSSQIDTIIRLKVKNDGDAWACDKKEPNNYVFNFDLKKQIENWDRFESTHYKNQEENIGYILGAGESDFLKLHYNEDNRIIKLEYRSEDPG